MRPPHNHWGAQEVVLEQGVSRTTQETTGVTVQFPTFRALYTNKQLATSLASNIKEARGNPKACRSWRQATLDGARKNLEISWFVETQDLSLLLTLSLILKP